MLVIISILIVIFICKITLSGLYRKYVNPYYSGGALTFCCLAPIIFFLLIQLHVAFHHCEELALVRNPEPIIAIYTKAIEDLDRQMENLSESIDSHSLLNSDSPYRSLIETKSKYVSDLAAARLRVFEAKNSIYARKIGLNSHIVSWFGDE